MADRIGISLQAGINISQSTTNIKEQIRRIQESLKPLNITIDEKTLIQVFDKVSSSIGVATDGSSRLEKNIINITAEEGKLVSITQTYNKEMNAMSVSGIKVVNNLKAQNIQAEKLATTLQNAYSRQTFSNFNQSIGIGTTSQNSARESAGVFIAQQEVSDNARRLMVEEENQRVATTTEAQRRIEKLVTGSNQTIAEQQQRMNSINAFNYEQVWLRAYQQQSQAEEQLQLTEQRNVEIERQRSVELQRQIALYQEQNALTLRNMQAQYGSLTRNPAIQSQISSVRSSVGGLSSSVLDAEGFRTQSAQINTAVSGIRTSLNEARTASNNFGNDLAHNALKMLEWTVCKTAA